MSLSTTIPQTQTDAMSSHIITHLTSQCACKNNVISDRSEEVSGSTDWATSPGFIASALPSQHLADRDARTGSVRSVVGRSTGRGACLDQMGPRGIAFKRPAADPTFRVIPAVHHRRKAESPAKLDQTRAPGPVVPP